MSTATPLPSARRLASLADLDAVPDGMNGEILDGELVVSPRPRHRHTVVQANLLMTIGPAHRLAGPGGWVFAVEPELRLGFDPRYAAIVPDLAGWRVERAPDLETTLFSATAPDWVCEILSPRTTLHDRAKKMPFYARAGVSWAWLVDPASRVLEIYERTGDLWIQRLVVGAPHDGPVVAPPFEAAPFDPVALWGSNEVPPVTES